MKERYLNRQNVKHASTLDNEWKPTENKKLHVVIDRLSEAIENAHNAHLSRMNKNKLTKEMFEKLNGLKTAYKWFR